MHARRTLFATACLVAIVGRWGVGVQPVAPTIVALRAGPFHW
jgi:hypothetical protein